MLICNVYIQLQEFAVVLHFYYIFITFSRRINIQHRLVYQVLGQEKIVKIISIWTHYEK